MGTYNTLDEFLEYIIKNKSVVDANGRRVFYKEDMKQKVLAEELGVQRQTIGNKMKRLIEKGILVEGKGAYYLVEEKARDQDIMESISFLKIIGSKELMVVYLYIRRNQSKVIFNLQELSEELGFRLKETRDYIFALGRLGLLVFEQDKPNSIKVIKMGTRKSNRLF